MFDEIVRDKFSAPWPPQDEEGLTEEEISAERARAFALHEAKAIEMYEKAKTQDDSRKRGYYKGRHYTDWVESVEALKRAQRLDEAEELLYSLIQAVEAEDEKNQQGVASWYYEQLAILYRKQKNYIKEVQILERYMVQRHSKGSTHPKLAERLEKAKAKVLQESS
jgi:tetratricopeptide (TPR) repeat protein